MDEEQQLRLANQIAEGLPEVTRSEWMRWIQLVQEYGIEKAIELAGKLGGDVNLRPAIQRSNQLIARTMQRYIKDLSGLNALDQSMVLGFTSRLLIVNGNETISRRR